MDEVGGVPEQLGVWELLTVNVATLGATFEAEGVAVLELELELELSSLTSSA
jgi:hypothetical protein